MLKSFRFSCLFILFFFSFFSPLFAKKKAKKESKHLNTIQIKVPRFPSSGKKTGSKTIITREQFGNSQQSIGDILEQAPGVHLIKNGGPLSQTKIRMRGSFSDQVLVIIDGVTLQEETESPGSARIQNRSGIDFSRIPLNRVESIEIVRGASSSRYGAGAAAGAIIIKTRKNTSEEIQLEQVIGPAEYYKSSILWNYPHKKSSSSIFYSHRETSGEYLFFDPDYDQDEVSTDKQADKCAPKVGNGFRLRKCNRTEIDTFSFDFYNDNSQKWGITLEKMKRDGLGGVKNGKLFGKEEQLKTTLRFLDSWKVNDENEIKLNLNSSFREKNRTENTNDKNSPVSKLEENITASNVSMQHWFEEFLFKYGIDLKYQNLKDCSEGPQIQNSCSQISRNQVSTYLQWDVFLDSFTLESSLRYDQYSDIDGKESYRSAVSYYLSKNFGFKTSYATGYRPPSLYELFDPASVSEFSASNSELKPETSQTKELGFFIEFKNSFSFESNYFEQKVKDNIIAIADPNRPALFRFENVNRTKTTGFETVIDWKITEIFSWSFSHTIINPIILNNDDVDQRHNGNQIPGVPKERWKSGLKWKSHQWSLYLNYRYTGPRFIDNSNIRFLKEYRVVDAGFNFPLPYDFEGSFEGKNVTNETYTELENYPIPGRQFFISIRWNWKKG